MTHCFKDNQKSYSFRIELTSGSKIHLCGIGHHDSAKWIQDIRHETENIENKQEYEIISSKRHYMSHNES